MQARHPDFIQVFFLEQHFQRFLTAKYNRPGEWYYYLLWLPVALLPWTPAALAGLAASLKRKAGGAEAQIGAGALAWWAVVVVAFFSTSRSKLMTYVLPAVPALCLLAARALEKGLPSWSRALGVTLGIAASAAALSGPLLLERLAPGALPTGASLALTACLASIAAVLLLHRRPRPAWGVIAGGGFLAGALLLVTAHMAEDRISIRPLARSAAERLRPGDLVYSYGSYPHGLPYYLGRRVDRMIYWIGELHVAKRYCWNAGRFGDDNDIRALPLPGRTVFVAMKEKEGIHFKTLVPPGRIKGWRKFGGWVLAEL